MKAIYINIDQYLQAVADWLNAGHPGTVPSFNPLPLAVTIPLGETAGIYIVADAADAESVCESQTVTVNGQTLYVLTVGTDETGVPTAIAFNEVPGFSPVDPSIKYAVLPVTGSSIKTAISIVDAEDNKVTIPFAVLVRREQASGPVDLVDFTPPAAAIAAGTDLKGTKFNGNEIVAAAGTGALSAPAGA